MSLARIHLLDSDVPLKEGEDRTALCGKLVPRAVWAFMWDDLYDFDVMELATYGDAAPSVCARCKEIEFDHRYIYGLVPGQEARTAA